MAGDFRLTASLSTTTTAASAVNLLSHDHPSSANLLRHAHGHGCFLPTVAAPPSAIPTLDLHRIPPHRDTVHFIAYTFAPPSTLLHNHLP